VFNPVRRNPRSLAARHAGIARGISGAADPKGENSSSSPARRFGRAAAGRLIDNKLSLMQIPPDLDAAFRNSFRRSRRRQPVDINWR